MAIYTLTITALVDAPDADLATLALALNSNDDFNQGTDDIQYALAEVLGLPDSGDVECGMDLTKAVD